MLSARRRASSRNRAVSSALRVSGSLCFRCFMTEEEWHRFVWGCDPQIVTLGQLPRDLWRAIGASSPLIRMEHYYARKCAFKHGFNTYHFPMLPVTIAVGRCVLERPGCLSFFCFDPVIFGKWFQVALKTDRRKSAKLHERLPLIATSWSPLPIWSTHFRMRTAG